jgi:hypothetical protein
MGASTACCLRGFLQRQSGRNKEWWDRKTGQALEALLEAKERCFAGV